MSPALALPPPARHTSYPVRVPLQLPSTLTLRPRLHLPQLSAEDREKLSAARPSTLAQAQRIPGVTPAALLLLLQHVKRRLPRQHEQQAQQRRRLAQSRVAAGAAAAQAAAEAGAGAGAVGVGKMGMR